MNVCEKNLEESKEITEVDSCSIDQAKGQEENANQEKKSRSKRSIISIPAKGCQDKHGNQRILFQDVVGEGLHLITGNKSVINIRLYCAILNNKKKISKFFKFSLNMEVISIEESLKESESLNGSNLQENFKNNSEDKDTVDNNDSQEKEEQEEKSKPKRRTKRRIIVVPTTSRARQKRYIKGRWRVPL
ncbi:hypothetical protein KQX54_016597 [Cotesia glomerata]|uniref:Uncharacterized protein n=1 Tax=Cotesia glomerata TaxID=32391 RepID=A0AAV7IZN3_COTGL|nr:hypothetical protein KQX54_016597 [Cotesia glomerata]